MLGERNGWRLDGDLAIRGYGDPFLVTEEFRKLLRSVRHLGLTEINGDLVIDDTVFVDAAGDPGEFDGDPFRTYNMSCRMRCWSTTRPSATSSVSTRTATVFS